MIMPSDLLCSNYFPSPLLFLIIQVKKFPSLPAERAFHLQLPAPRLRKFTGKPSVPYRNGLKVTLCYTASCHKVTWLCPCLGNKSLGTHLSDCVSTLNPLPTDTSSCLLAVPTSHQAGCALSHALLPTPQFYFLTYSLYLLTFSVGFQL